MARRGRVGNGESPALGGEIKRDRSAWWEVASDGTIGGGEGREYRGGAEEQEVGVRIIIILVIACSAG